VRRHVDPHTRREPEAGGLGGAERRVALPVAVVLLQEPLAALGVGWLADRELLRSPRLEEEVVFGVAVGGGHARGATQEDVGLPVSHVVTRAQHVTNLVEDLVAEHPVGGVLHDIFEDHPGAVVLDVTGDFARWLVQAGGALAISEDLGDVTEVVFDAILGEASDEFTDRVKLQQRVLSQVVRDRERLTVVVGLPRGGVDRQPAVRRRGHA
jgi:hypothetical protein